MASMEGRIQETSGIRCPLNAHTMNARRVRDLFTRKLEACAVALNMPSSRSDILSSFTSTPFNHSPHHVRTLLIALTPHMCRRVIHYRQHQTTLQTESILTDLDVPVAEVRGILLLLP